MAVAFGAHVFLVVYKDRREVDMDRVWAARFGPDGEPLDPVGFPLADHMTGWGETRTEPSVAFDGSNFVVTWAQAVTPEVDCCEPTRKALFVARVSPDGRVLPPGVYRVASFDTWWAWVSIAADAGHSLIAISSQADGLLGMRLGPDGSPTDRRPLQLAPWGDQGWLSVISDHRRFYVHFFPFWSLHVPDGPYMAVVEVGPQGPHRLVDRFVPGAPMAFPVAFDGDAFLFTHDGSDDLRPGDPGLVATFVGPERTVREPPAIALGMRLLLGGGGGPGRTVVAGELEGEGTRFVRLGAGEPRVVEASGRLPIGHDEGPFVGIATGDGTDLIAWSSESGPAVVRVGQDGEVERTPTRLQAAHPAQGPVLAVGPEAALVAWHDPASSPLPRVTAARLEPAGPVPPVAIDLGAADRAVDGGPPGLALASMGTRWWALRLSSGIPTLGLFGDAGAPLVDVPLPSTPAAPIRDFDLACEGETCLAVWVEFEQAEDEDGLSYIWLGDRVHAAWLGPNGDLISDQMVADLDDSPIDSIALAASANGFVLVYSRRDGGVMTLRLPTAPPVLEAPALAPTELEALPPAWWGHRLIDTACLADTCLAAFRQDEYDGVTTLHLQRVGAEGPLGPPVQVRGGPGAVQGVATHLYQDPGLGPSVCTDGADFLVTYATHRTCGTDLLAVRVSPDGVVSEPITLRSGLWRAGHPSLARLDDEHMLLVYQVFDPAPPYGGYRVVADEVDVALLRPGARDR